MIKAFEEIRISPIGWLKAGLYACAIGLVYYSTLLRLIYHDWNFEDYSHCSLIPFAVLYLIWEKRVSLAVLPSARSWGGLAFFLVGISLFWLGELSGEYFTLYLSLWFVIVGLTWVHIGWQKIKSIAFALIMMLFMFPFPNFINVRILTMLQLISSKLGVFMLQMVGMSAYREGNVIDLGFTQLQVVEACSGLRYVLPLMVLSLILAYWFKAHIWKRAFIFLSSIPLAIFVNSFRIALTGIIYSMFGAAAAEGFFHGFSGWLIFVGVIPVFLVEIWVLRKLPPKSADAEGDEGRGKREEERRGYEATGINRKFLEPKFIASMAILLLTLGLSQGIEFRQKIPINRPFSQFPMQVGAWHGTTEIMEKQYSDFLNFSDYIIANYTNPEGKAINFYVAYYQDQRKGESIHSPETCLPASGWEFKDAGDIKIPLSAGNSPLPVNRAFMAKASDNQLVYYWFPQRGRILTKLYQLKLYTFWDSLTKQRTDGSLVRVITRVYPNEPLQDAEMRLQGFTREIVPVLDGFLPGR